MHQYCDDLCSVAQRDRRDRFGTERKTRQAPTPLAGGPHSDSYHSSSQNKAQNRQDRRESCFITVINTAVSRTAVRRQRGSSENRAGGDVMLRACDGAGGGGMPASPVLPGHSAGGPIQMPRRPPFCLLFLCALLVGRRLPNPSSAHFLHYSPISRCPFALLVLSLPTRRLQSVHIAPAASSLIALRSCPLPSVHPVCILLPQLFFLFPFPF